MANVRLSVCSDPIMAVNNNRELWTRVQMRLATYISIIGHLFGAHSEAVELGQRSVGKLLPVLFPQTLLFQSLPDSLPLIQRNPGKEKEPSLSMVSCLTKSLCSYMCSLLLGN